MQDVPSRDVLPGDGNAGVWHCVGIEYHVDFSPRFLAPLAMPDAVGYRSDMRERTLIR